MNIIVYILQGKKKHNIDIERLTAILRERGWPSPDASRSVPKRYWFLIASALSNCNKTCAKYILAVYKCGRPTEAMCVHLLVITVPARKSEKSHVTPRKSEKLQTFIAYFAPTNCTCVLAQYLD